MKVSNYFLEFIVLFSRNIYKDFMKKTISFLLGGRRRAVVTDRSKGGANESRHSNYQNLKIEVQFNNSPEKTRLCPSNEYED